MKRLYTALWTVVIVGLFLMAAVLSMMPDTMPVHFNFAGEPDRWGSKLEYLLFPGFGTLLAAGFAFAARKVSEGKKILLWTGVGEAVLFDVLGCWFCFKAAGGGGVGMAADFLRGLAIFTGVLLAVLGNFMPKARRNAFFGLRNKWSMANDVVWQKCQRWGGISAVVVGLTMALCACILSGVGAMIAVTLLTTVWAVAADAASYRIWKKDTKN